MSQEMVLDLFAPGMTPMHRAGIGGLATTLLALEEKGVEPDWAAPEPLAIEGLSWTVEPTRIVLRFKDPAALVRLVQESMSCEGGLIAFQAFMDLPMYQRLETRLHMHQCLLDTLLQHRTAVRSRGAEKQHRSIEIDGRPMVFSVKELTDFVHRFGAEKLLDERGNLARSIQIKGWAMPGGKTRHETAPDTVLKEPPERYLALLFAIIGVVIFRLVSPRRRKKYAAAVIMPEVKDLGDFARARRALVQKPETLTVTGLGDAVLIFFAELQAAGLLPRLAVTHCHAIAMGSVPWAAQQKTRTYMLDVSRPDDLTLARVDAIRHCFPLRYRTRKGGQVFETLPLWRELFTDNLAQQRPLWAGLSHWLAEDESRERMMKYERKQVVAMVREHSSVLGTEAQIRFVRACHEALRQRYGQLGGRVREEDLDARSAFERENEQIRMMLARCRNVATVRSAIVDFWSRGGRNTVLQEHWQAMLHFLEAEPWDLVRDLALLALVSYARPESDATAEEPESAEESE